MDPPSHPIGRVESLAVIRADDGATIGELGPPSPGTQIEIDDTA